MANPLVPQGTLNRLRASMVLGSLPGLNVTAAYLGKAGISINPENDASLLIPTLTGGVTSNEPYQMVTVVAHILKTQALSAAYRAQIELNTNVGDMTVISDTSTFPNFPLVNCTITHWDGLTFDGNNPEFVIHIKGIYYINSAMWNFA